MNARAGPDLNDLPCPEAGAGDRATARPRRRTRRGADLSGLNDLPCADAGARDLVLVRPVGGLRIGWRCPPQAAGLRNLLGGCDQMRDKNRTGPGRLKA